MKQILTDRNAILIIIVVAVLVRLLYLPIPFIINVADGAGYVAMADEALRGRWTAFFDDYTYRTPLYPFLIAFSKIVFGNFWRGGLAWLQHLFGVIMAVLIYLIAKKVFSKGVGFLAGLLAAANAYQVYWEHNSMSDFFFTFMTVLSFYFLFLALTKQRKKDYFIFGILFGLNLLVRPLFQAFPIILPFLIYLFTPLKNFRARIKNTMKRFAYIMIPVLLIIAPWFYQHWHRHRYFGFTPFLGVQLMVRTQNYMGFKSPLRVKEKKIYLQTMVEVGKCTPATILNGTCGQVAVAGWSDLQRKLGYSAVEANQALTEIALEAIKKNPGRYLRETAQEIRILLTRRAKINFYGDPDLEPHFREQYLLRLNFRDQKTILHQKINWKLTFDPAWITTLAFWGMFLALVKKNLKSLPFTLITLYIILVIGAVEHGSGTRYRIPIDPFMFIFAVYFLISILQGISFLLKKATEEN